MTMTESAAAAEPLGRSRDSIVLGSPRRERLDGYVDCCCLLDGTFLVVSGWAYHPDAPGNFSIRIGDDDAGTARLVVVRGERPDVTRTFEDTTARPWGFVLVAELTEAPAAEASA